MNLYKIRRELHKIPELGFEEFKTHEYIVEVLKKLNGLKLHTFDFPGILVEYSHGEGDYKLYRADMDGLPITEQTDCSFSSIHAGKMHACGHDIHMTVLIGLIEKVIKENLEANLLFLFQPAEEGRGGAERILETGIFDKFKISECFALHTNGSLEVGEVSSKPGIFFANTQEIEVVFKGISAHVAFADKGKNALKAGADFYLKLEEEINLEFPQKDAVICAFGKMNAGVVMNAIPAECILEGTFRAFSENDHEKLKILIEKTAAKASNKHELEYEIIYKAYYKEVVNDAELFHKLKNISADLNIKFNQTERVFTGEDFGFLTDRFKGLLFWLGAGNKDNNADLHSPEFLADEKAIDVGLKLFYALI